MSARPIRPLCSPTAAQAVVVDDREDVWAAAEGAHSERPEEPPSNLLLVRPYHWSPFSTFADVNNTAGADLAARYGGATSAHDDEADRQLPATGDVLRRLHERFYSLVDAGADPSVPLLLRAMRREVLGTRRPRARVVLSGIVPLHHRYGGGAGPRCAVLRHAEELGAEIGGAVDEETTHVVAARDLTDKALAGRRVGGCAVVLAGWLMECAWGVTRVDEGPYLFAPVLQKAAEAGDGAEHEEEGSSSEDDFEDMLGI